jgi:hypothetical protein
MVKVGIAVGVDAALTLGDGDSVGRIIDEAERLPSIRWSPVTSALVQQANARLYVATGETDSVDGLFAGALDLFRQTGARFWLATTLAHRAEWLRASGREDEARLACDEARSIFEHLGASVWLDRVGAVA